MASDSVSRLEQLRRREATLRTAIAEEKVRQQKRAEKDHARLASIVGECLLADLEVDSKLGLLLEESLKRNATPRDAEFLKSRGWRI
ncbi:hypothetical protein [Acidicapsa ligni]|uniref:hypothetical protein n=1 Tax=Acidicapsa ligni TaxID=542300 RepID=UPI0021DFA61F|nr:hypothetical protein [Acidicapsa ligni]